MGTPVYGGLSQTDLDLEYSPSSRAPRFRAVLGRLAELSERARTDLPGELDLRYGADPDERLDFFPSGRRHAPLHVFVHGGHWQESSKEESAFAAPAITAAGASFVALGYGLAPRLSMEQILAQVRRALIWLRGHARDLGVDPDRLYLSGSSAGAHLVAAALSRVPGPMTGECPTVAGACLLSGVYDLEPVRLSYVNDALGMDVRSARRHSPLHHLPCAADSLIVARGERETDEYARQHRLLVSAARRSGCRASSLVVPDRDHFALPADLGVPGTSLGDAVLEQMGLV